MKTATQVILTTICLLAVQRSMAAKVEVDLDSVGMGEVTWSERLLTNATSRLTLKATAASGFAFAGWLFDDREVIAWPDDSRYPGTLAATVVSNADILATFIPNSDDGLEFDVSGLLGDGLVVGEHIQRTIDVDSVSFPELTFTGLPPGITYDARTLTVFGRPTTPGVYEVTVDGVNGSDFAFRSIASVRVENLSSGRITGVDDEILLGEYFYAEPADLFFFNEEPTSVSLTTEIPGLTWDSDWQLLYGAPTTPGVYTLSVTANFVTGAVETATMTLSVVGASPDDYGLDLTVLDNLTVGDELDESYEIGVETSDAKVKSVTGLPSGLKAASRLESGVRRWYVSGIVREPGFFNVMVQVDDRSDETQRVAEVWQKIAVADIPDVYMSVTSADVSRGTVSGGGAVSPAQAVTLIAKPKSSYVFSGWYDADGGRLVLLDGVDYRESEVVLPAGTDFALLAPIAHFASKVDDVAPDLSELEDVSYSFAPNSAFSAEFSVDSLSLPKLSFQGLPDGVRCLAVGDGGYVLTYDPTLEIAKSGRYSVTVTAVNQSGYKSSVVFDITIEPQSDARIRVYDDYGEFVPGEEIEAISLAGAVDFARGETLSVSGLPRGLAYNSKANPRKSIEAHTIIGTPTVPGYYTLKFDAKVVSQAITNKLGKVTYEYDKATATSFMTVLPYPAVEIDVDEEASEAGCKVSGVGNYKPGTKVALKASSGKGWVFAGWDGLDDVGDLAALNSKIVYVTGEDDLWIQANFMPVSDDWLSVVVPSLTVAGFAAEWPLKGEIDEDDGALIADLIDTGSWPTVKVEGLPAGVKFSASTLLLSGAPTKSGVFHVTITARNAGGYSFVRVIDLAVLNADGSLPSEKPYDNAAGIDFAPLKTLMTGVYYPTGTVVLAVNARDDDGLAVKKVSVSGLPTGLSATTALREDGGADLEITGTPSKPGRQVLTITIAYDGAKSLKSQTAIVVEDGGSQYLWVMPVDASMGTVTGEGVYSSGATVKLVAKAKSRQVFSGWQVDNGDDELVLFSSLADIDGIDPRTATVKFPFRPSDLPHDMTLYGAFAAVVDDAEIEIDLNGDTWTINPDETSEFSFAINSESLPKISLTGLPKGVAVDAARGLFRYTPAAAQSGIYGATITAKNMSKASAEKTFEVRVLNRTSDVISGLDSNMEAYPLSVGVTLDPSVIAPSVDDGWTLSVAALPSGLAFVDGSVSGTPSKAGDHTVTFTATAGSGSDKRTEIATITLRVAALPIMGTGTFIGVVTEDADSTQTIAGTINVTATTGGKITAVVNAATGKYSYSANAWNSISNGVLSVAMVSKDGSSLYTCVDSTMDWQLWQMDGRVWIDGHKYVFSAQRNSFGDKDGVPEAVAVISGMTGMSELDIWKLKIAKNGVVTIAGKYAGKTISGKTVLQCKTDASGINEEFFARYVIFPDDESTVSFVFYFDEEGTVKEWKIE